VTDQDPWDTEELQDYQRHVREHLLPMVQGVAVTMSIVPEHPENLDLKYMVELAACILLDKPLILLVVPGTKVPEHLLRVADAIVEADMTDPASFATAQVQVQEHFRRLVGED